MAGLSFDVTQNLKLDLGYRYLDYGKFTSGTSHCLTLGPPPGFSCGNGSYVVYSKNDLASNDFRIGLRWMIGEATPPPPAAAGAQVLIHALASDLKFAAPACPAPLSFSRVGERPVARCQRRRVALKADEALERRGGPPPFARRGETRGDAR